jgi:hypothetical protein
MKYRSEEMAGIKRARKENPGMSQRGLARYIYDNYIPYSVGGDRSKQSIYSTIRRVDRQIAAEKAARTATYTAGNTSGRRRRKPAVA